MTKSRKKKFDAAFKAKVALEALREDSTRVTVTVHFFVAEVLRQPIIRPPADSLRNSRRRFFAILLSDKTNSC
jgi:hypothetical protein